MDLNTLRSMLQDGDLGLSEEAAVYTADTDRPLTLYVSHKSELLRFTRINAIDLSEGLTEHGLVKLKREKATTLVVLDAIFAVEREHEKDGRERRTGFA